MNTTAPVPKTLGQLETPYGKADVIQTCYRTDGFPMAIVLDDATDGENICTLSTSLPEAEYKLQDGEFFAKTWSENEQIAKIALASGLFTDTGRREPTGWVEAHVWKIK